MVASIASSTLFLLVALFGLVDHAYADSCFTVDVRFTTHAPASVLHRAMVEEVGAVWARYGVHIQHGNDLVADECDQEGSFDVFVDGGSQPTLKSGSAVLGRTHVGLDLVEHVAVHIDYDATTKFLESLPRSLMSQLTGQPNVGLLEIGRALGRVLAHEIGHVILAAPIHQEHGLMRRSYLPEDLVALQRASLTLSDLEVARLRSRERILATLWKAKEAGAGGPGPDGN